MPHEMELDELRWNYRSMLLPRWCSGSSSSTLVQPASLQQLCKRHSIRHQSVSHFHARKQYNNHVLILKHYGQTERPLGVRGSEFSESSFLRSTPQASLLLAADYLQLESDTYLILLEHSEGSRGRGMVLSRSGRMLAIKSGQYIETRLPPWLSPSQP